jgi:hypothetical protein
MCQAGYGRIVLTSSIGGLYGNHRVANYGMAKAGLIGLSGVVALEGAAAGVPRAGRYRNDVTSMLLERHQCHIVVVSGGQRHLIRNLCAEWCGLSEPGPLGNRDER